MPKLIEIIKYQCEECCQTYSELTVAELCENRCVFKKYFDHIPTTENEWRDIEPKVRKPTEKWTAWSNYGLSKGW